ncbi:MAG: FecR domain-containing protein [Saprospiraceae bacterium]|nr:FecR domain-containing protein [Saprospiraceae bacterium]
MKTEEEKDKLLIRWLEGDLTAEESSIFENTPEFKDYQKIVSETEHLPYPQMDTKIAFANITKKISKTDSKASTPTKIVTLRRTIMAIAAVGILLVSFLFLFSDSPTIYTNVGQYVSHILPDGSKVVLNGNSAIDYRPDFTEERRMHLEGEAFFNVQEGSTFRVKTNLGSITVLGTSFNVFSRDEILVVACKTGKVQVESGTHSIVLSKGESIRIDNQKFQGRVFQNPNRIGTWQSGDSYFSSARLEEVILSLSGNYDVTIDLPPTLKSRRFTGSFVHNDLKKALNMVLSPMGISYKMEGQHKVVFTD